MQKSTELLHYAKAEIMEATHLITRALALGPDGLISTILTAIVKAESMLDYELDQRTKNQTATETFPSGSPVHYKALNLNGIIDPKALPINQNEYLPFMGDNGSAYLVRPEELTRI